MENPKPAIDEMYCSSCGSIIKRRAEFCMNCGVRTGQRSIDTDVVYSDRSRLAAGLLGILVGYLGVHRFYLGNIGIGIIQIIVTFITFGIGSIWGFIEGILIIAGANWKDAEGKPLRKWSEVP